MPGWQDWYRDGQYNLGEWLGPGGGIACGGVIYLGVVGKMVGGL